MTKKIGSSILIKRLMNRFNLSDLEPEILKLSETVIPVTNADFAMMKIREAAGSSSVTATGNRTLLTVPDGKRYYILAVSAKIASGTWSMSNLYIASPSGGDVTVKSGALLAEQFWEPAKPTYLDRSWKLGVTVDVYAVTGNMTYRTYYYEVDGDNE